MVVPLNGELACLTMNLPVVGVVIVTAAFVEATDVVLPPVILIIVLEPLSFSVEVQVNVVTSAASNKSASVPVVIVNSSFEISGFCESVAVTVSATGYVVALVEAFKALPAKSETLPTISIFGFASGFKLLPIVRYTNSFFSQVPLAPDRQVVALLFLPPNTNEAGLTSSTSKSSTVTVAGSSDSLNVTLTVFLIAAPVVLSTKLVASHHVPVVAEVISGATESILKLALVVVTVFVLPALSVATIVK